MGEIMTVKEVAEYIGIHYMTLYNIVRAGKTPAVRIGGQWRFHKDEVQNWVRGRRKAKPAGR